MSTILDELMKVDELPECVDRKPVITAIVKSWAEKSPVIADAFAGKLSFEAVVKPVVEENRKIRFPYYGRGYCSSTSFLEHADAVEKQLEGIIAFGELRISGKTIVYTNIASKVGFSLWQTIPTLMLVAICSMFGALGGFKAACIGGFVGLLISCVMMFVSDAGHYADRRYLAENVLQRARKLDGAISVARS